MRLHPVQQEVRRKAKFQEFEGSKEVKDKVEETVVGGDVQVEDELDFEDSRDDRQAFLFYPDVIDQCRCSFYCDLHACCAQRAS